MPQPAEKFPEREGRSSFAQEPAPMFSTLHQSASRRQDSFQLGRVMTSQSITHDMSTGSAREGAGRGYGFDQADSMLPAPIARFTSRRFLFFEISRKFTNFIFFSIFRDK